MRAMSDQLLEEYLDGELTGDELQQVEALAAADSAVAARLTALRRMRQHRRAALDTYRPSAAESAALARLALERSYIAEYAPLATLGGQSRRWLKWAAGIAACLLISVGSFLAGNRMGSATGAEALRTGYTVKIESPDGQTLSQTFATYRQAQRFVQTYQVDQATGGSVSMNPPAAQAASGVF